jgi:hypothetical protein
MTTLYFRHHWRRPTARTLGPQVGQAGGLKRKQYLIELEEPDHARAASLF